jgi:hypothetical protein
VNKKTLTILGIIVAIIAIIVGYQLYLAKKTSTPDIPTTKETVVNKEFKFSFVYLKGSDGFTLVEPAGSDKGILKAYLMLPTAAYNDYKNSDAAGEAPAGMNVFVFDLSDKNATSSETDTRIAQLQNWATDNSTLSSIKQAKNTPDVVELDGIKGLHYQTDGLYQQDVYLISYKSRVYMMVGQYNKQTDLTYTAFQDLIKSLTFE